MYIQIEFQSKELSHTSQSHLLSSPGEKTLDPHAKGLAPPLFSLQVLEHRCWNLDLHLFIRLVRRQSLARYFDQLFRALILCDSLKKFK